MLPGHSRTKLVALIDAGEARVDGRPEKRSLKLVPGQRVELPEPEESAAHDLSPAEIPLEILFEDEHLLIVNKPRGLATHPAPSLKEPSLVNALLARPGTLSAGTASYRPGIVHRLDKDTTGLLMVAKTDRAHRALAKQIEEKSAERRYFAIVRGRPERELFKVDAPIGRDPRNRMRMAVDAKGKPAQTWVRKIADLDAGTLLAVRLLTGRTHQIRVHLGAVGLSVAGDALYGGRAEEDTPLQLHAGFLRIVHPETKATIAAYGAPPEDFLGRDWAKEADLAEDWGG